MTPSAFDELATWRYEPPYDFYNGDEEEVLNPERFFSVREDGELIGFYYYEPNGDVLDYGLGLRPDLTGLGRGLVFFRAGLEFGRERYSPRLIQLHVAAFNERAVKVYERAGFRETGRHMRSFERWGEVEFITMQEQE
jgi:aminoglycoside 6'-N-acetyltransferase/ribosomal-protein-alanine N-acetyltransferase